MIPGIPRTVRGRIGPHVWSTVTGGWTAEAAAEVAGLEEDRALDLTEALARHSLVQLDHAEGGPRLRGVGAGAATTE